MNNRQIIISVILTIVSLVIGYYLNVLANRASNKEFLNTLREEMDIIDSHYERLLSQAGSVDAATQKYLQARREYLKTKLNSIEKMYQQ